MDTPTSAVLADLAAQVQVIDDLLSSLEEQFNSDCSHIRTLIEEISSDLGRICDDD